MSNDTVQQPLPSRDEGSVLPMILALMVVGSLAVVALLTFATTLYSNRPPIEVRDRTFWTAKSAMSMAMTLQRENGPDGCYQTTDSFSLNGYTADVTCTPTGNYFGTGRGRFAVITTSNDQTATSFAGRGPGAEIKPVTGDVFVNGGSFGNPTTDLGVSALGTGVVSNVALSNYASAATPAARYFDPAAAPPVPIDCGDPAALSIGFPDPATSWSAVCQSQPWWEFAGDLNAGGTYDYPELPPLPAYARPSVPQATIGSCNVYFPGQYASPLTLGAGQHFFPSGVYYFEGAVTLSPGAQVVAGEGRWPGCTFDAEAAFAPTAPNFHAITGKGATFVLGGGGRIVSTDASLRINRRVSDSTSRGTETVAIRSVNFRTTPPSSPQPVEVPDDVVYVGDVYDADNSACNNTLSTTLCLQRAVDHKVRATASAPDTRYTASTQTPADTIISISQTGGSATDNQFVTDGYVFVPNSKVVLRGGANTNYRLRLSAGVVASSVELDYQQLPSLSDNWFLGVLDEPIQRQVDLFVAVSAPNGQRTVSRAIMEVNIDESYAINGWTVDPNAGKVTKTTVPTTTDPTATTTTDPTATTTTDPTATTTTDPTATTTTTPGPTSGPCNTTEPNLTDNFGEGPWKAEFWDHRSTSGFPSISNMFAGSPTATVYVDNLYRSLPNTSGAAGIPTDNAGAPIPGIGWDQFSIRFTRTLDVSTACTVNMRVGGDDGFRVLVNGVAVAGLQDWSTHAVKYQSANVSLPVGTYDVVFEYFENTGHAVYDFEWKS